MKKNISVVRSKQKTVVIYYNGQPYAKIIPKRPRRKISDEAKVIIGMLIFFAMVIGGGFFFNDTPVVEKVEAKEIPKPIVIEKIVKVKDDSIPPILRKIALAESMDSHYCVERLVAKKLCKKSEIGQVLRGVKDRQDVGRYQISLRFHKEQAEKMGLNLLKEKDNEKYALWLFETQGSVPWSASAFGASGWIKKQLK